MNKQTTFLTTLLETPSAAGYEETAANVFIDHVKPYAYKTDTDVLNNPYAFVGNPEAETTILVEAHKHNITHQLSANYSATGGTNASKIQLSNKGVRSLP